eukprot:jgi/Picsp_1/3617/NSC_06454-R1_rna polymerase ii-associated protein 3-like
MKMKSQLKASQLQAYMKQLQVGLQDESHVGKKERCDPWNENQADLLRERGNRHFRAGRIEDACSAYSASIEAGPSSAALANRAMAYLKLGDLEKCIADCDQCLEIDSLYVKAYLRRGTARKCSNALLQAIKDFEEALRLEPHNESAIENRRVCIDKIRDKSFKGMEPTKMEIPVTICGINEMGNSMAEHAELDTVLLKPVEVKRKRHVETKDVSDHEYISSNSEIKEVEEHRNQTQQKVSKKRGNMHDDRNEFPVGREGDTRLKLKPPKSGIDFEKTWRGFKQEKKSQLQYLLILDPGRVPTVFRQSFSPKMLFEVASLLLKDGTKSDADTSIAILESMTHIDRFDMNLMSLSKSQRGILQEDWKAAAQQLGGKPEMDALKLKYKLD